MEVGYGSKKNFYQTFEKWLHMTPKTARLLDHTRRELLKQSLARLVLKVCTASAEARVRLMRSA
jgi:AraC-like DNA-binding protein